MASEAPAKKAYDRPPTNKRHPANKARAPTAAARTTSARCRSWCCALERDGQAQSHDPIRVVARGQSDRREESRGRSTWDSGRISLFVSGAQLSPAQSYHAERSIGDVPSHPPCGRPHDVTDGSHGANGNRWKWTDDLPKANSHAIISIATLLSPDQCQHRRSLDATLFPAACSTLRRMSFLNHCHNITTCNRCE